MSAGRIHLVGVGGSGMSSLAVVLAGRGFRVSGSDRDHDRGRGGELFAALTAAGVELLPQDGRFLDAGPVREVVVSGAVESRVADVLAAREADIPVRRRAEVLADLLHRGRSVAVAGTSGKSTVTAMVAWILRQAGRSPTFVGGAPLVAPADGTVVAGRAPAPGAWTGTSDLTVAEADESDGTLTLYRPDAGVVTNLTQDHRPLAELAEQLTTFSRAVRGRLIVQGDPARLAGWSPPAGVRSLSFAVDSDADVKGTGLEVVSGGMRFRVDGVGLQLPLPGRFNVENALAALATARALDVPHRAACGFLESFPGLSRRMERVGEAAGVLVVDDFAHNPDKVAAALAALEESGRRLRLVFQLHGFGPARMHRQGLTAAFGAGLRPGDRLYMLPIYYAGGTVERDISADDYVADLQAAGVDACAAGPPADLVARLTAACRPGDTVVIMGARDPSLPLLARQVLQALGS